MVHLAFMGCGSITAERHLPEALAEPAVVISGFCNRSLAVSEAFQAQYGGIAYPDFEAVLADPLVDAVVIATPNCFHSSQSVQALRAGKHVLCEKPMAITLAQGEAMVAAAQESGRVLMIGHNQKLEPAFQSAKKILDSGALGRVLSFHGMVGNEGPEGERPFPWFFQKELAGMGVTGDLGIHMVDSLLWLLGEPISQVQGMTAVLDKHRPDGTPIEVEDTRIRTVKIERGQPS